MKQKRFFYILAIIVMILASFKIFNNNAVFEENNNLVEEKTKSIEKNIDKVKITLVGDLLFEQPFYNVVENGYDRNVYFSKVSNYFEEDDLTIGNMEVVIGNDSMKVSGEGYNFCAPKWVGDLVSSQSFEVLSTSNNHAFDRGVEGINSTIDYFKNTNIKTVGTRKSEDDSFLLYLEKNNIKFGITSYTYGTNQKNSNRYMVNYYKDESGNINKEQIKNDIDELKKSSDVVIVLIHWGLEFRYNQSEEQKNLAKYLNELGVDIIVGSHSHNISPMEVIESSNKKTLVYYSMGNFVSHDDDIARTPQGDEEFDNAYQVGLLSTLNITKENDIISIEDIKTEIIVNYFDSNMQNFMLIPFHEYSEEYEKSHLRYNKGLTKEFIKNMYNNVIDESFRTTYE